MVHNTHINFLQLLFILVGKICPSMKEQFVQLLLNRKTLLAIKGFRSPPPSRSFTCTIFCAIYDSGSSFFAPKPHRNASYAGYL